MGILSVETTVQSPRALPESIEILDAYPGLGCNTPKGSVYPNLIAKDIKATSTHTIVVLKPIVDTIALTVTGNAAFGVKPMMSIMDATATAKDFWDAIFDTLDQFAHSGDEESGLSVSKKRMAKYKRTYKLELNGAQVRIGARPWPNSNAPLRFEFSAPKMDDDTLLQLTKWWASVDGGSIPLPALLHDARITRLDIAVDVLNLHLFDIYVSGAKVKKIWAAINPKTGIESAYYYWKTDKTKFGWNKPADMILYDKRRELEATGKAPAFGPLVCSPESGPLFDLVRLQIWS